MSQSDHIDNQSAETKYISDRPGLRIGSRLLADAYAGDGTVLLSTGQSVNSDQQLDRLLQPDVSFGLDHSIEMPIDFDYEAEMDAKAALAESGLDPSDERLVKATVLKTEAVKEVADVFSRIGSTGVVDVATARNAVTALIGQLVINPGSIVSLVQLKSVDAYTYTHSVNVGILAMYMAMATRYERYIEELGTGALLHDIGKINIPTSILRKNGPLTREEFQIIREHPRLGAILLLKSGHEEEISLSCVLHHHEKITGSGYPFGKRQSEISPFARITGIADVYDALTTDRPYRKAMTPSAALQLMVDRMGHELDPELLARFIAAVGHLSGSKISVPRPQRKPQIITPMVKPVSEVMRSNIRVDFRA